MSNRFNQKNKERLPKNLSEEQKNKKVKIWS